MNATHHRLRVDLDTAGAGPLSAAVADTVARWSRVADREGSLVVQERLAGVLYEELPRRLGALLGAPVEDVVVCGGSAQAFAAVMSRLPVGPGERVWVSPYASPAQLSALSALRARTGCRTEVIALGVDGAVDLAWMARRLDEDVAAVCLPYVSAVCGTVQPVHEVGRLLAGRRCLYAVDASYAVGQLPLDVAAVGCDLLTGDGWRFLRGPHGTGFAYTAPRLHEVLAPHGGLPPMSAPAPALAALNTALTQYPAVTSSDTGTDTVADAETCAGAGTGAGIGTSTGAESATAGIVQVTSLLRAAVGSSPGTELIAAGGRASGVVAFRHDGVPAAVLRRRLADRGILVGKIVAGESPLFLPRRGITTAVRVSVSHDTTLGDIALFADALSDAIAQGHPQTAPHAVSAARTPFSVRTLRTGRTQLAASPQLTASTLHAVPAPPAGRVCESAPLPSSVAVPSSASTTAPVSAAACVPVADSGTVLVPAASSAVSLRLVSSLASSLRMPAGAAVGASRLPLHGV